MPRENYSDLIALVAVAQERNFTRAAAKLGVAQSTLSHTVRQLEARLGVRLLTRTTRSVSLTESGERLIRIATPRLENMESELRSIANLGQAPAGTIRITATEYAADTVLWPRLTQVLERYSHVKIDLSVNCSLPELAQSRQDFAVIRGDLAGKDTNAVRIGPDIAYAIVAAPNYLASRGKPSEPQELVNHECIRMRDAPNDVHLWKLGNGTRSVSVAVSGRLTFNGCHQTLNAALSGHGLAYVPDDLARPHIEGGRLVPVLEGWWHRFPGYHLHYSNLREVSHAMRVVIDELVLPA